MEFIAVRDTDVDFGVLFSDLMHGRLCFGADFRRVPFTDAPWSADGIDFRFSNDGLANHALSAHTRKNLTQTQTLTLTLTLTPTLH